MAATDFDIDVSYQSCAGVKDINEDASDLSLPNDPYLKQVKGYSFIVADGVSSAEAGREASHIAVERFLVEYYQTPDMWSVSKSGEQVLSAINLRLFRKSHQYKNDHKGYLTTLSALVLKGHKGYFFHVGDSRIYLLRDNQLTQLTQDHCASIEKDKTFLTRAVGMDNKLHIDYSCFDLQQDDRYLLCSDGVHDFISEDELTRLMNQPLSMEQICIQLIDAAEKGHSDDNMTCLALHIKSLPQQHIDDLNLELTRLPFPPILTTGMKLDGYRVLRQVFASSRSHLYLVEDEETHEQFAMKVPSKNFIDDIHYIDRFIREQWIGSRIESEYVVKIIQHHRPRTGLYYLMEWLPGISLDKWLEQYFPISPKRAIELVKKIALALEAFHQHDAVHQDLKPANIIILDDDRVKIVDFGSVFVAGVAELYSPIESQGVLGTASYSDPNYLQGKNPGIQGDIYSLATLSYEVFTHSLPYGQQVEECRSIRDYDKLRYISATSINPIIPVWFDKALEKGVKFDLYERYNTVAEFMTDLTQPNPIFLKPVPEVKQSNSLFFWKLVSGFWFITLLVVIYLFSQTS
ncbi:bifunctional protein-serine/threonine kinase/phosphatase [Shewanella aestuarii]|uniref:Bifunctional protein-serine/threonine kinase/phosphatase n=1 Tax=Shewanella aestuarii TaxID=1028752 RepID=A0A6G9QP96_9GAMM|nr:bifunctional protein-serine/threonine kinase/phosphatase [Shewanella aestuarii]QIR16420.1 bifunctional protein-serine/threonine kinase/phosphatase [Shewanella aestuarii]